MIAIAAGHPHLLDIDYRVVDATDREALLGLGAGAFDGALCNMALMDMAEIEPLMTALAVLFEGRRTARILCSSPLLQQSRDRPNGRTGGPEWHHCHYLLRKDRALQNAFHASWLAMHGQPVPHPYFHRPLSLLLAPALSAGLVLDGFEEEAFPPDNSGGTTPLSWNGRFSEIPAALIVRRRHAM
jgi:hypothetical protein